MRREMTARQWTSLNRLQHQVLDLMCNNDETSLLSLLYAVSDWDRPFGTGERATTLSRMSCVHELHLTVVHG
eukprot:s2877_g6.t1